MILLDTHAWLWLASDSRRLSVDAREAIGGTGELGVAAISLWEVAMLASHGRIQLDQPTEKWLWDACSRPRIRVFPVTPDVAAVSVDLPMHGDPADRMIVATAKVHQLTLVTADEKIRKAGLVSAIW